MSKNKNLEGIIGEEMRGSAITRGGNEAHE